MRGPKRWTLQESSGNQRESPCGEGPGSVNVMVQTNHRRSNLGMPPGSSSSILRQVAVGSAVERTKLAMISKAAGQRTFRPAAEMTTL